MVSSLSSPSRPHDQSPRSLLSLTDSAPGNVASFTLCRLQELSQSCNHNFLSLCCSPARHCRTHSTGSNPLWRPQAPGPSQCAAIPLSLTSTGASGPHPAGRPPPPELRACAQGPAAWAPSPRLPCCGLRERRQVTSSFWNAISLSVNWAL